MTTRSAREKTDRLVERLAQLKHQAVPRCSIERLGVTFNLAGEAMYDEAIQAEVLRRLIDQHLRHYAWLTDADGRMLCPGCMTRGWFSWGLVHGSGNCSCGWPGRKYHRIEDPSPEPDAPCRVCDKPPVQHEGEERRCPGYAHTYTPPYAAFLDVVLWAHPYEVKAARR